MDVVDRCFDERTGRETAILHANEHNALAAGSTYVLFPVQLPASAARFDVWPDCTGRLVA